MEIVVLGIGILLLLAVIVLQIAGRHIEDKWPWRRKHG